MNMSSEEDSVAILTQGIARLMDINCPHDKLDKYIKQLRSLCFGPPEDKFSKYFGLRLSPDECLDGLLRLDSIFAYCLSSPQEGHTLAHQLLKCPKLTKTSAGFLAKLLPHLLQSISMDVMTSTLELIWKYKDKSSLPLSMLECMVLDKRELEAVLIQLYLETSEFSSNLWDDTWNRCWVNWSSQSSLIFQSVTNILNNVLIHCNNRTVVVRLISQFVQSVDCLCSAENRIFIKLYPLQYQSLITLLKIDPQTVRSDPFFDEYEKYTVKTVREHLSDPHVGLMLLSHFPKWLPSFHSPKMHMDLG